MLFHSQPFILGFLPACLAGCFMLRRFAGQNWALAWLLAASLFFYGCLIANLPYLSRTYIAFRWRIWVGAPAGATACMTRR